MTAIITNKLFTILKEMERPRKVKEEISTNQQQFGVFFSTKTESVNSETF